MAVTVSIRVLSMSLIIIVLLIRVRVLVLVAVVLLMLLSAVVGTILALLVKRSLTFCVIPVGIPPHFLKRFQISTLYAAVCSSFKSK